MSSSGGAAEGPARRVLSAPRIRAARRRTGLSQKEFAAQLGVSPSTLCDWEKGRSRPAPENLLRFCGLTGEMAPLELLGTSLADEEIARLSQKLGNRIGLKRLRILEEVSAESLNRTLDELIADFLMGISDEE